MAGEDHLQSSLCQLLRDCLITIKDIVGEKGLLPDEMLQQAMMDEAQGDLAVLPGLLQFAQQPRHGFAGEASAGHRRSAGVLSILTSIDAEQPDAGDRLGHITKRIGIACHSLVIAEIGIKRGKFFRGDRWHRDDVRAFEFNGIRIHDVMIAGYDIYGDAGSLQVCQMPNHFFMVDLFSILGQISGNE
ncbi:MAG: hypothetical protein BWY83_01496 [bacterium ADurb.Bin478]|nr:MAG: hypothetical protein BWY83_01496 [bacterium ADurb.Bin478]